MINHVQFPGLGLEFTLNSEAFSIGSFSIKWYGIIIAVGFLLAFVYALASCKKMKINQDRFLDVVIVGIVLGIIGARLYYCLFFRDANGNNPYIENPVNILYITKGGLAIYGGIIGGLLGGALMAKLRRVKITAVLDVAALGFLIGQAIGRWGNFVNQEAFGIKTNVPWRMYSENTQVTVGGAAHPCFLYESLWCILGFVLLHFFTRKWRRYDGQTFLLYLIWYGVGRFFIEGLRIDSLYAFGTSLRVSQLVAVASVVLGCALLIVFRKSTALLGCGSKAVMELNAVSDEVPEEDVLDGARKEADEPREDLKKDPQFSTIFGDLGYEAEGDVVDADADADADTDNAAANGIKTEADAGAAREEKDE